MPWKSRLTAGWQRMPTLVRDNWRMLGGIALILAVWRMSILALSLIWWRVGVASRWPEEYAGMRLWRFSIRHDAEWYLQIAQNGYIHTPGEQSSVAFFPGLPLAIRLFDALLPSGAVFAGLVVVHLALVAALIYVYRLTRLDFAENVAWWTLGLLLMFPAAIYYSAIYPQSLLLLGVAGALYHARRGQWWLAGSFGLLAGATSLAGMVIVIPLAMELRSWSEHHQLKPQHVVAVALSPLGGLAYFAYLRAEFGSLRVFTDGLKTWNTSTASAILFDGLDYLRVQSGPFIRIAGRDRSLHDVAVAVELTLICSFLIAGALAWWKLRPSYGALVIGMTLVPVLFGSRLGIGGQVAFLFPVFILLARYANEGVKMTLSIIFTLGLGLTAFLFVQGFWSG